jgi:GDP-L-fucose synthase
MIDKNSKIYIAGHLGMVGSSCWRLLNSLGYSNLVGKSSKELDLRNQLEVENFFKSNNPDYVIDAAARVGGIVANKENLYDFLLDNTQIQNNLIKSSLKYDIKRFIFLGSSCIYPKFAKQPIKEEYLLSGKLELSNEGYAIAKISGLKLCQYINKNFKKDFISLMPTNLYGVNDNFDPNYSHVIPGMIKKFHQAKISNSDVVLWGSGSPMREFLNVDDLAKAIILCLDADLKDPYYNVGSGSDISILELSHLIQKIVGHSGKIKWNHNMPDGTPKKLLDSSKINELGWSSTISLENGIKNTYKWYLDNLA